MVDDTTLWLLKLRLDWHNLLCLTVLNSLILLSSQETNMDQRNHILVDGGDQVIRNERREAPGEF